MRLLFIRFSSIGDIVFTTPAIRCAKLQIPNAEIHFLTKTSMKAVTEANPYIDHFHYFNDNLSQLVDSFKEIKFDYIIDLHNNFRTFKIKKSLGVPALTYQKLSIQKLLLTKWHFNFMPKRHISDRCLDTLKTLGVVDDGKGLDHFVPKNVSLSSKEIPTAHQAGYVAFVIGASFATKKLPLEQLRQLCHLITYPIVLIGGKEDASMGDQVALVNPIKIYNACGKFNLHESALLVQQSKTVVSHDTGFLYIACAFHKKTVAIWGATSPALQVEPYYPKDLAVQDMYTNAIVPQLSCQPCSNYGTKVCPQGHFACMRHQNLSVIAQKVNAYFIS
ncbi:MAG: glycosyltransferase family 9 protein [Chitinophagia bacterium]|jgi:ADP-heptose:LPS heptosyltransferase|nr:glycosyltransferase family 9 protein [Chitinophagia bacterium]